MKVSYTTLIVGSVAALAWWGSAIPSTEKPTGETQARSRIVSPAVPTSANSINPTRESPAAWGDEPTESCGSPHRSASEENLEQELGTLQRKVARLDTELAAVRRRLDSSGADGGNASSSPLDPEIDEEEARAQEQQEWQGKIASTEWKFRQEPVDAAWAAPVIEKIQQAYELEELAELLVQAIECRSTLCRVEVALDDQTNQLIPVFALHVADMLPKLTVKPIADGDEGMVLFLTRRGQE